MLGVGLRVDFKTWRKNSLFLAVLDICCCRGAFSHCRGWGLLFTAEVCGLLVVVSSLVAGHRL